MEFLRRRDNNKVALLLRRVCALLLPSSGMGDAGDDGGSEEEYVEFDNVSSAEHGGFVNITMSSDDILLLGGFAS